MTDEFALKLSALVTPPEQLVDPEMLMFYGPPGGGKTWLAASASEVEGLYPMLIIDMEGSTQGTLESFDKDRIDVIRPFKMFPGEEYAKTIGLLEGLLANDHKYKTVVIDTADVLQELATSYGTVDGDGFARWNFTHDELTAPPFKRNGKWISRGLFHRLKAANFLVILVVHDKQETNEDGVVLSNTFQWAGQGKAKLPGIPDAVLYVTRDTKTNGDQVTTVTTTPTKRTKTKNRVNLPPKLENATMKTIYEQYVRNTEKKENK